VPSRWSTPRTPAATRSRAGRWALALKERSGWQKAVVALANKNARILWAVMTRSQHFDPQHISVKPGAIAPA
jgi:transposase